VTVLFHSALEQEPEERPAFLDHACGSDIDLRDQVELLLAREQEAGSFMETPAAHHRFIANARAVTLPGRQFGPYRIVSQLGAGGMGEVYRARDSKLGRDVALKTLPAEFARDSERLARLRREARTLASLNHPNIAAIYGLEESGDLDWLVLELVEGETLRGPLPIAQALDYARQVAEALEAAHEKGVIHRDLKPSNVKVTAQGRVKVLDFGLAKAIWGPEANQEFSQAAATQGAPSTGHILGTPGHMSPEQTRGQPVDERTDIWAFGCLLYELLAGKRAFAGDTVSDAIVAVLEHEPDWQALPVKTPTPILHLLQQCLEKDPQQRLGSIAETRRTIEQAAQRVENRRRFPGLRFRYALPAAVILLLLGFLGVRLYQHNSRVRWVREQVLPELERLSQSGERKAAFRLMRHAEAVLPGDPALQQARREWSIPMPFQTNPPGAEVWVAEYGATDGEWLPLGRTPFTSRELTYGYHSVRIVKPGFETILGSGEVPGPSMEFDLDPVGSLPPDMVRVPGGNVNISGLDAVKLGSFLIDRYEITNRQFKQFLASGGYRKPEYWKQEFVKDGRKLSREEAMRLFVDSTGRPGPSTWELGEYPPGEDDYPVNGVSWYEAAAYAEFAGKQLPTIYHWERAAAPGYFADVAQASNFGRAGPARVGAYPGRGAFGTFDMAGNVKEWCWNEIAGKRYIRGGAWNEPIYMFAALDARLPWDRSPQNGIRCARYDGRAEAGLQAPVSRPVRDYLKEKPVSDEVFHAYGSLYAYDTAELDSRVEGVDEDNSYWKREKISFAAGYGNERVAGYLYLPKRGTPPYQTIVVASPSFAYQLPSPPSGNWSEVIIKSGRALLIPVLKGQYQRRYATPAAGPHEARDRLILESKDFSRSIDYLVTRKDIDRDRLGVFSASLGVKVPLLAIGEQRLKAVVLVSSGLWFSRSQLPEADPFNFLSRFHVPTLVVVGRYDFVFPLETSTSPMFRLLGAPEKDKRLALWEGGHVPPNDKIVIKETLDWFDRYLGPVK
jgi:serine/threonine protein kinase/pimeloyl-ACP methyl ester carboxylesterase